MNNYFLKPLNYFLVNLSSFKYFLTKLKYNDYCLSYSYFPEGMIFQHFKELLNNNKSKQKIPTILFKTFNYIYDAH